MKRVSSEAVKKQAVKDLISKHSTIKQIADYHQTSLTTVYRWLYKYSQHHEQKCTLVVQMESEEPKNSNLQNRNAELERIINQKQLEIDFLNKLFELGSSELGFDLKKALAYRPGVVQGPPKAAQAENECSVCVMRREPSSVLPGVEKDVERRGEIVFVCGFDGAGTRKITLPH